MCSHKAVAHLAASPSLTSYPILLSSYPHPSSPSLHPFRLSLTPTSTDDNCARAALRVPVIRHAPLNFPTSRSPVPLFSACLLCDIHSPAPFSHWRTTAVRLQLLLRRPPAYGVITVPSTSSRPPQLPPYYQAPFDLKPCIDTLAQRRATSPLRARAEPPAFVATGPPSPAQSLSRCPRAPALPRLISPPRWRRRSSPIITMPSCRTTPPPKAAPRILPTPSSPNKP